MNAWQILSLSGIICAALVRLQSKQGACGLVLSIPSDDRSGHAEVTTRNPVEHVGVISAQTEQNRDISRGKGGKPYVFSDI